MHSDPATTAGFGWIQDSVESCIQCGYSWIQDTAGYAAFSCVLRSAAFSLDTGLRSAAFRNLRSAAFCVQLRSAFSCVLRSAFSCVLRSAAFCVQLRSGICVQLRSAFSCVQLGYSQAQSKASGWAFSVGKAGMHGPMRVVMAVMYWQLGMSTGLSECMLPDLCTFGDCPMIACLPS